MGVQVKIQYEKLLETLAHEWTQSQQDFSWEDFLRENDEKLEELLKERQEKLL